jgi:AcrR family transcriptional regulator
MSPRSADPAVRAALIAAAARLLAADGPRALSTRRLATEAGTTTMAVYTHFGSMDEVRRAVRQDGFARLTDALGSLAPTDDPVADLAAGAVAYFANGLANPESYRAMFVDQPPDEEHDAGEPTFRHLLAAVTRCVEAGRFDPADSKTLSMWAAEIWTAQHGMVTLALSRLLPAEQIRFVLTDMIYRLCVGFGDEPAAARASVDLVAES